MEFAEGDALVGVMIVKSSATVLPLHEDTKRSAGRSEEFGRRCSGAAATGYREEPTSLHDCISIHPVGTAGLGGLG